MELQIVFNNRQWTCLALLGDRELTYELPTELLAELDFGDVMEIENILDQELIKKTHLPIAELVGAC